MSVKIERPPVPHAEATKKATARLQAMNPKEARQTFVETGILTHDGKLTERYGGEAWPSSLAWSRRKGEQISRSGSNNASHSRAGYANFTLSKSGQNARSKSGNL